MNPKYKFFERDESVYDNMLAVNSYQELNV